MCIYISYFYILKIVFEIQKIKINKNSKKQKINDFQNEKVQTKIQTCQLIKN